MTNSQENNSHLKEEALSWLAALHSPSLSAEDEARFYKWLNSDPKNQKAFILAENLWSRGGALSKVSIEEKSTKKRNYFSLSLWSGAAYISIFFAISYLLLNLVNKADIYQTHIGERKIVSLEDGSTITLNTDSKIEVNLESTKVREVVLNRGEAYFNIYHNKDRPFKIFTEEGSVVVLGTQFSVHKKNNETVVTVTEGRVRLIPNVDKIDAKDKFIELTVNQRASLSSKFIAEEVNSDKLLAWRDGLLNFEGEPLINVIEDLNRYYTPRVQLSNKTLESRLVIAALPLTNTLDKNLAYIKNALNLDSQLSTDKSTIVLFPKKKNIH